ncbi:MAG: hydantoinase/oxoprolinase family protein, partial [Burkholderiales bacterium]|nr:hydantoinase/oxoprolinase family protein [Burkholderiales bacterium]
MTLYLGTDIGGTFTDLVGYDSASGELSFAKTLTTPSDLVQGVLACLDDAGIEAHAVDVLKHGTTQVINTLLERTGARTALVTTEGFRDVLEIGRASRPRAFDLDYRRSPPLAPAWLRLEVRERIAADGSVLQPLGEDELERVALELERLGAEAVAVSFLNAYRNPVHEEHAVRFLRRRLPRVFACTGTELTREWFEYERTATAVANAYVGPRGASYIERLDATLAARGFAGRLYIMASNGGVLSAARARLEPVSLVESGPIGGCIGAAAYARELGLPRLVAFDMGGTTAKCALVEECRFEVHPTYHVGGYDYGFPIRTPVLDIVEVGTGGGSIAFIDPGGGLRVGPRSAGSDPGPVGFGRGGAEPTVTDANLALDRIAAGAFLHGALPLDREAARRAIDLRIGRALGYAGEGGVDAVANGVLALADLQMASAIREITVERGRDVREFVLFAFGGGGPMHAVSLARELRIPRVIVPPEPGHFSALGMLLAGARLDEARTLLLALDAGAEAALRDHVVTMRQSLARSLRETLEARQAAFEAVAELRFAGQRHSLRVEFRDEDSHRVLRARFFEAYRRRYGFVDAAAPVELVGVRVTALAPTDRPAISNLRRTAAAQAEPRGWREVYFREAGVRLRTAIYARQHLA